MDIDVRTNPGLLKLELYCLGMQLDDSCHIEEDGGRGVMRTRAGLGSGLELILPGGLWTNVPVTESFTSKSPYVLRNDRGRYTIFKGHEPIAQVTLSPRPSWYDQRTSTGKPMTRIGSLQGTYLGIYPAKVCDYWLVRPERENCKFCSVGLNLGVDDADTKSVDEVLEVVHAARRESRITYVDFNTGHYAGDTYLDILAPYIERVKRETGLLVGIQTPPHHDLRRYDELRHLGVNRVSFCFEIFDPERFVEICPGKHREYGLQRYLEAVEYCARLSRRRGAEPWVSNGEIIAGLERPESSMAAIDWITSVGAIPTVCVFRPLRGTDYEEMPPPRTEDLVPVFRRLYEACIERGLPIGLAPNIHVSLVLLPEECRWFSDRPRRSLRRQLKLKAMAWAYRLKLESGLRKHRQAEQVGANRPCVISPTGACWRAPNRFLCDGDPPGQRRADHALPGTGVAVPPVGFSREVAMITLNRTEAVAVIRKRLLDMVDEEHSMCQVAAERGIYCHGFKRDEEEQLRRRYSWLLKSYPGRSRKELEDLANKWELARQVVNQVPIACDAQALEKDTCDGWDGFDNSTIARFYEELVGEEIRVVDTPLS